MRISALQPGRGPARGAAAAAAVRGPVPPLVRAALATAGRPLDAGPKGYMESRFGHDFSRVRIHTGPSAERSARSIGAEAFTVGTHVVFGRGDRPEAPGRGALLAHELAHVVQQSRSAGAHAGAPPEPGALAVEPSGGPTERAADRAARRVVRGEGAGAPAAPATTGPALQRAEDGTYVSKHGEKKFLDAGYEFYKSWGHPNVRRVSTLDDVFTDLARRRTDLDTFRIVSHALPSGLQLGLTASKDPDFIDDTSLEYRTAARFRKDLADLRILSDAVFDRILAILRKDAKTKPLMATLKIDAGTLAKDSPAGLMLRAIMETRFLADVELPGGGRPNIPDEAILKEFNRKRLDAFRKTVELGFAAGADRKAARKAISGLILELPRALKDDGFTFDPLKQSDADTLADPFKEAKPSGSGQQLQAEIAQQITEGSGRGPFLGRLAKVRKRVKSSTHVEIRGCQIGQNPPFLDAFRAFVGGAGNLPSISAPDLYQYFFPLSFETFPATPQGDADLAAAFADPAKGTKRDFALQTSVRAGEQIVVSIEESPADFIKRYNLASRGIDLAALKRLNPEIRSWTELKEGTPVFLKTRSVVTQAGDDLEKLAKRHFGSKHDWPTLWARNPQIKDPKLPVGTRVFLQSQSDRTTFGAVAAPPGLAEFEQAIRAGKAQVAIETLPGGDTVPRIRLDDPKRAKSMGEWLAKQRFDPKGRTAAVLSRLFTGGGKRFKAAALKYHMSFLSRSYPNVEDPIFPDDPRFKAHIIRKP